MTNEQRIEDLLIEFDEFDMQPMILVPNPVERAIEWKHKLVYAIEHLKAEVAIEIFAEIEKILAKNHKKYSVGGYRYDYYEAVITEHFAELKKKYIGDQTNDNTKRT